MKDIELAGNANSATDFLGKTWYFNCMGCAITSGQIEIPGGPIYEGNIVLIGVDPQIPIPGFLIINVKRHVNSFSEFSREERIEIADVIAHIERALRTLNIANEVTLVQEERARHFHMWIVPQLDWMTEKFGKGITHLKSIIDYAKEHATQKEIDETLSVADEVRKYFETHDITK